MLRLYSDFIESGKINFGNFSDFLIIFSTFHFNFLMNKFYFKIEKNCLKIIQINRNPIR